MRNINLILIHCTATRENQNITPQQLTDMHLNRGFKECGYHYYITKNGILNKMRDVGKIGAHAKGNNANSIGIAYEGGLNSYGEAIDTRTNKQKETLLILLEYLKQLYPNSKIMGHRDLSPDLNQNGVIEPNEYMKECPCFDVAVEYKSLQKNT